MDHRDQRPPRSAYRQQYHPSPPQSPPIYPERQYSGHNYSSSTSPASAYSQQRPAFNQSQEGRAPNISFQDTERGDRQSALDQQRQRVLPSAYQNQLSPTSEGADHVDPARVGRKKSLVKPDREKIEPGHRQWHYRTHAAQMQNEGTGRVGVQPSSAYFRLGSMLSNSSF
jgi:chitin synthase